MNEEVELVQDGLRNYLERKRVLFNRFFFLSHEELIAVYGEVGNTTTATKFLPKMFDGIEAITLSPDGKEQIISMCSREGEQVKLLTNIVTKGATPERWLKTLES